MTEYEDLAFEPEMTWEDLVEWAKSKEYLDKSFIDNESIGIGYAIDFFVGGSVFCGESCIATERSPAQIKAIIENLLG